MVLGVFVSLRDPSLCRVIQVQIDLLFGLNLHTTSEMKYFFFKNILFSAHKHPRASLVCSVPSPKKRKKKFFFFADKPPAEAKSEEAGQ